MQNINDFTEPGQFLLAHCGIDLYEVDIEQIDHYIAVENYLTDSEELPPDATNLERVKNIIEGFYHLCKVENWELAREIFLIKINPLTDELFPDQLCTWGYYQEAVELYQPLLYKLSETDFNTWLLERLGFCYEAFGKYYKAIDSYEESLAIQEKHSLSDSNQSTFHCLGNVYLKLGDFKRSLYFYGKAYEINPNAYILLGVANAHIGLGNYDLAKDCLQKVALKALKEKELQILEASFQSLGILCRRQGKYSEGLEYIEQCLIVVEKIEDPFSKGQILGNMGNLYLEQGDYEKAIKIQEERIKLARDNKDIRGEMAGLHNLSNCYSYLKKPEEALKYQKQSLAIAQKIDSSQGKATALTSIGSTLIQLKKYKEAIEELQKALEIIKKNEDPVVEWNALINLGDAYDELCSYSKAFDRYISAYKIIRKIKDPKGEKEIMSRLSDSKYLVALESYLRIKEGRSDDYFLMELGKICLANEKDTEAVKCNYIHLANVEINLAKMYYKQGNYELARKHAKNGIDIAEQQGVTLLKRNGAILI